MTTLLAIYEAYNKPEKARAVFRELEARSAANTLSQQCSCLRPQQSERGIEQ